VRRCRSGGAVIQSATVLSRHFVDEVMRSAEVQYAA
jgi:hypothetical protein